MTDFYLWKGPDLDRTFTARCDVVPGAGAIPIEEVVGPCEFDERFLWLNATTGKPILFPCPSTPISEGDLLIPLGLYDGRNETHA